jgi:phospholipid/cholesterol/gamma-HCH transport system permease protein
MAKNKFIQFNPETKQLECHGEWDLSHIMQIKENLESIQRPKQDNIIINGKNITQLDTAGAWLLNQWAEIITKKNLKIQFKTFSDPHKNILSFSRQNKSLHDIPIKKELNGLEALGRFSLIQAAELYGYINFIGKLFFETIRVLHTPKYWRWNTIASVINKAGASALPIIALLAFMIGVVITYEIGIQLKNYGANIYIVNLIGYTVLREFGPLMTAIIFSSRTGSAITAQIGLMKMNSEINALVSMGMTADELLILPRMIAIVMILPLLTIWADMFGVIGGIVMAHHTLDIAWLEFLTRFQHEIPVRSLIIGLGKTLLFAFIIASISCFQGMEAKGSAESVGACTTRSVVLSIFFIIIVDAFFSMTLNHFNL